MNVITQPDQHGIPEEMTPGLAFVAGIGLLLVFAHDSVLKAASDAEIRHNRAELLQAYRRRRDWKASDKANLRTLPLSAVARRRLEGLRGTGRPVVRPHRDLAEVLLEKAAYVLASCSPLVTRADRLKAIKHLPWWPHYVEALYRGEYVLAKAMGQPSPSDRCERLVGEALGISQAKVRALSGDIRRLRRACFDDANFPATTLAEFEVWLEDSRDDDFWSEPVHSDADTTQRL